MGNRGSALKMLATAIVSGGLVAGTMLLGPGTTQNQLANQIRDSLSKWGAVVPLNDSVLSTNAKCQDYMRGPDTTIIRTRDSTGAIIKRDTIILPYRACMRRVDEGSGLCYYSLAAIMDTGTKYTLALSGQIGDSVFVKDQITFKNRYSRFSLNIPIRVTRY